MRIKIIHDDISELGGDAVVNSTDSSLLEGCGVNEAIHQAAGPSCFDILTINEVLFAYDQPLLGG